MQPPASAPTSSPWCAEVAVTTGGRRTPTLAKGRERLDEVLEAAERRLLDGGPEGLTLRSVADDVGISVGNLQYYLPTRVDLLAAVMERQVGAFRRGALAAVGDGDDARAALLALVRYWFDTHDTPGQSLIWQLQSLGAHVPEVARIMQAAYDELFDHMARLLRAVDPALTRAQAVRRAATISALIEGTSLFVGHGRDPRPELRTLRSEVERAVVAVIDLA